jgi:hypothetical protein
MIQPEAWFDNECEFWGQETLEPGWQVTSCKGKPCLQLLGESVDTG